MCTGGENFCGGVSLAAAAASEMLGQDPADAVRSPPPLDDNGASPAPTPLEPLQTNGEDHDGQHGPVRATAGARVCGRCGAPGGLGELRNPRSTGLCAVPEEVQPPRGPVALDFGRVRQRPGHQDGFGATQAEYLEAIYEKLTAGQRHRAWPALGAGSEECLGGRERRLARNSICAPPTRTSVLVKVTR